MRLLLGVLGYGGFRGCFVPFSGCFSLVWHDFCRYYVRLLAVIFSSLAVGIEFSVLFLSFIII